VSLAVTTNSELTKGAGLFYPLIFGPVNVDRYHGMPNNSYPYPCDDDEKIRLDEMQYVVRTVYGGNVIAPISKRPTMILDLGTGSGYSLRNISYTKGAWAIEVADEFPTALVIGMDLSPIQPHHIPGNCEFRVGDITQDLAYFNDGSVDLIHSRCVNSMIERRALRIID
jgi:SAM-dependent methyltransferase